MVGRKLYRTDGNGGFTLTAEYDRDGRQISGMGGGGAGDTSGGGATDTWPMPCEVLTVDRARDNMQLSSVDHLFSGPATDWLQKPKKLADIQLVTKDPNLIADAHRCRDGTELLVRLPFYKGWLVYRAHVLSVRSVGFGNTELILRPVTVPREEPVTLKNEKTKKFYVGNRNTCSGQTDWAYHTEAEAIDHARRLVESSGQEQYIVKIVKVVKRKPQPIVVETVQ